MKAPTPQDKRLILFENKWLEKLTVVSATWFMAIWAVVLPAIAYVAWGSFSPAAVIGLFAIGMLAWIFFEYAAHRHLFHWDGSNGMMQQIVFVLHGNHHTQPNDLLRNLMPPIVSLPVASVLWLLSYAVAGDAGSWIFLGFISGYVMYDLTHYACHQWPMRTPLGRMLKKHHMRHHFVDSEGNYAITAIFLDRVFGTHVTGTTKAASVKPQAAKIAQGSKQSA